MRRIISLYVALFSILLFLSPGCQPQLKHGLVETEQKVKEAKEHVDTVEQLNVAGEFATDVVVAKSELDDAEIHLARRKLFEAYTSAMKSIQASQRILRQFYLDRVATLVGKLKADIEETKKEDSDNPIADFLPKLDEMLAYAKEIQRNPQAAKLETVVGYLEDAVQIKDITQKIVQERMESDISFGLGSYKLSEKGKSALKKIVQKIVITEEEYLRLYPEKTIIITIKVVGYTDTTGFREGTNLVKKLIEGFENLVPQSRIDRRHFLNQRLSTFRAQTIGDYFRRLVLQDEQDNSRVVIEQDIVGKGEELPPDVPQSNQSSDPWRRICKIYSYVIAK